jgi:hypothetical protein
MYVQRREKKVLCSSSFFFLGQERTMQGQGVGYIRVSSFDFEQGNAKHRVPCGAVP